MEDLIRRSDAIKAIKYTMLGALNTEERISLIMDIPTIEPKRGEWVESFRKVAKRRGDYLGFESVGWSCSECGHDFMSTSNFCPNCGADMRGGGDE